MSAYGIHMYVCMKLVCVKARYLIFKFECSCILDAHIKPSHSFRI